MGYDALVEYKKGRDNAVADALSRGVEVETCEKEVVLTAISMPTWDWIEEIKLGYGKDPRVQDLMLKAQGGNLSPSYSVRNGLLFYKNRLVVAEDQEFRLRLLHLLQTSPMGGHSSYDKTLHRVRRDFHWQGMKTYVKQLIRGYDTCQSVKAD